ncbi:hypothetical protein F5B21DRAFT_528343 [Xylaria acuta]|nr:hypothetical protein F5B21DRAFT_528343 [Xylaria acuta]
MYRPDEVKRWEDFTLENFELNFKDITLHEMEKPKVCDAGEITSEDGLIFEESSFKKVVADWNIKVVQHALDDWCLYQKSKDGLVEHIRNLLPGDTKPAKKWKSEWIDESGPIGDSKACLTLTQLAKYMYLGKTRYGFIISEEEIVALRLSTFNRKISNLGTAQEESSYGRNLRNPLNNNYKNRVGIPLEFCSVPWTSSDIGSFTVNLTLWWPSVLAIRDPPTKERGTYSPLGACTRGLSPAPVGRATRRAAKRDRPRKIQPTSNKRRADDASDEAPIIGGSQRYPIPNRRPDVLGQPAGREGSIMADRRDPGQSSTSTTSSRAPKRRRTQR